MQFSYTVSVRKFKSSSKLRAVASVTIDNLMIIDGFKVIEGSNGYFVSVPNHKGTIIEDGVKVEKYFDDIRFPGEEGAEFAKELKDAILNEYRNAPSQQPEAPSRGKAAAAHSKKQEPAETPTKTSTNTDSEQSSAPNRTRKPIWDFS